LKDSPWFSAPKSSNIERFSGSPSISNDVEISLNACVANGLPLFLSG
jgi:hypothetical protein